MKCKLKIIRDYLGQITGNQSLLRESPVFKLIPLNGGEVSPPRSIYLTSSPINRIENARRRSLELFQDAP